MIRKGATFAMAAALGAGLLGFGQVAKAAEVTLRAITSLPKPLFTNKPFWSLMEDVNTNGKGVLKITYIGGPEAMPVQEQMGGLSRGIVDVYFGPTSYFDGDIPEVMAQNASNKTAMQARADGAVDLMNKVFNRRVNAQYLGYFGSGYTFHIYLKKAPKRTPSGGVDLSGLKVRGATVYRPFFEKLGINTVLVHVPEMYTALDRGVIEGAGWTNLIAEFGWDKFLKYRIWPTYWQGDLAVVVNLDKWKSLSAEAQDLLQNAVIKHEKLAHNMFVDAVKKEDKILRQRGMQDIILKGDLGRSYRRAAYETLWEQLNKKLPAAQVAELRAKFFKEE